MSFGRRLALFFVLIVLVPLLALVGVLVIVSEDSRQGKADARLASGLETALALYDEQVLAARPAAERLAGELELGDGLRSGDTRQLDHFVTSAARGPRVAGVRVLGPAGTTEAASGSPDAVAFAKLDLADGGAQRGALLVSVTTADRYAAELKRLTGRDLVVSRSGTPLAATVEPPATDLDPGQTGDIQVSGREYRAHALSLNGAGDETVLMIGPEPQGAPLAIGRPAVVLLVVFLLVAVALAYAMARTLTGLHSRVAEQAITDPLTGLWNRRRMDQLLHREVDRALRFGHELSVLIVDVDDFKQINDVHGHLAGDEVLETIGDVVRRATRSIDVGARYGGDELALLLLETSSNGAEVVAERLRTSVREAGIHLQAAGRMELTVSVGAATLPDCAGDAESLIDAADQALLVAKRAGKDQIRSAPGRPRADTNGHGRSPDGADRRGRASS
jgi:diguanylate cyclase (GGDEF)-like protein